MNGGPWAKVELDFADGSWGSGDENLELRIWFLLDGATDCYVRLRKNSESNDGQAGSVELVDTGVENGQPIEQVVRERSLSKKNLNCLTVEYRYGLVMVNVEQSVLLRAIIPNGSATVTRSTVSASNGSSRLDVPAHITQSDQGPKATNC